MKKLLDIIEDIQKDFNVYSKDEKVRQAYKKDLNIHLEFKYVDGFEYDKAVAKVTKNGELYKIEIYRGLIEKLYNFAEKVISNHITIFFGNEKLTTTQNYFFKDFLFMTWINFIVFHEWWHILCGHLDYLQDKGLNIIENGNAVFWEDDYTSSENNIDFENLELKRIFELEADSKASSSILAYLIEKSTLYNEILIRTDSINKTWKHYFYILSFLFEFLSSLREDNKDEIFSTHPTPLKRMVTMTLFVVGELTDRDEMKIYAPTNEPNLSEFFIREIYNFQTKVLFKNYEQIYKEQVEASEYIYNKVSDILKDSEINEYRLVNTRFI